MVNTIIGSFRRPRLTIALRADHLILDRIPVVIDIAVWCDTQQWECIHTAEFIIALPHTKKIDSIQYSPTSVRIPDIGVTGVCRCAKCRQNTAVSGGESCRVPATTTGHIFNRLPLIICVVKKRGPRAVTLIAPAINQNLAIRGHRHRSTEHVVTLMQIFLKHASVRIPDRAIGLLGCRPGTSLGPRIGQHLTIWQYRHGNRHMWPVEYWSPGADLCRPTNSRTNNRLSAFCVTRLEIISDTD